MSNQPRLHVQNIFDALNPNGTGVRDDLKLRCLHLQKRVVALAKPGDVVAVSADCSASYVEYMMRTTGVSDVLVMRHEVSGDAQRELNSQSILQALARDAHWQAAQKRYPVLNPYMKSAEIYHVCEAAGIAVSQSEYQASKDIELSQEMNDKALFYKKCEDIGAPVPRYWVFNGETLADKVLQLLKVEQCPFNVRQTRSGGTVGNITVCRIDSKYCLPELGARDLSDKEFKEALEEFARDCFCDEFVVSEHLDLYASPGTLFFSEDRCLTLICHTCQIFDKNRLFLGFSFPIEDERIRKHFTSIEEWIRRLIEPFWERGYRGYGNIDWMVTKSGEIYLAECNARQTGVIPPLVIANACLGYDRAEPYVVAPEEKYSIVTRDALRIDKTMNFEQAYVKLEKQKLLWEQNNHEEGIIISIPPSPECNIAHLGIVAICKGKELPKANDILNRAVHALGARENKLLFAT